MAAKNTRQINVFLYINTNLNESFLCFWKVRMNNNEIVTGKHKV